MENTWDRPKIHLLFQTIFNYENILFYDNKYDERFCSGYLFSKYEANTGS